MSKCVNHTVMVSMTSQSQEYNGNCKIQNPVNVVNAFE